MESRLLEILVCPLCKGPLHFNREQQELICNTDKLAFPIRDGIPVMLEQEARDLHSAPSGPATGAATDDQRA
ncbi:MAG TPA: Trm112 family protein [Burkholderiaceae bacterium]|nr:Trm112 family protein [Burkholderiaceae bacterium]